MIKSNFVLFLFLAICTIVRLDGADEYKPENLGPNINTEFDEIRPTISPSGKILYFIRAVPDKVYPSFYKQEVWYSENEKGKWTKARKMSDEVNAQQNNAVFTVMPDENTLLIKGGEIRKDYDRDRDEITGYSFINKTQNGWGFRKKLKIQSLSAMSKGKYNGGYLSNDGKTLLMYFSELENDENNDLYVSFLQENGSWSKPMSLGKDINFNSYDEMSPFLASDGVTLYFASDRFGGFGSNDIWFSTRLDDSWTKWSKPVNMGANINTEEFEAYYSIDAEGEYAYMVSYNNTYGQGDIVRVKLLENQKPRPVTLISGKVIDAKTRKPLAANVRYEVLPKGNLSGNASSNPSNGAYKLVLPSGHKYGFLASAEGYLPVSENIDLTEQIKYSEIQRDLELVPIESGETIRLNNIFFETGKYDLSPESFPELDRLALVFASNPNFAIEVEGHTDNVGNDKKNTELSLQRAKSVKNYLQSKGVKEDKINAKGYGKTKPVAENDSDENRQKNRRVEFKILSK